MQRVKKPVSRIDHERTHGWLARVYRYGWSRGKSFADSDYGGSAQAYEAALAWVMYADKTLPLVPIKPILRKATVHKRAEKGRSSLWYFDVYLPSKTDRFRGNQKLYYSNPEQEAAQRKQADDLVNKWNKELREAHHQALAAWYVEHARLIEEIEARWEEVKETKILPPEMKVPAAGSTS